MAPLTPVPLILKSSRKSVHEPHRLGEDRQFPQGGSAIPSDPQPEAVPDDTAYIVETPGVQPHNKPKAHLIFYDAIVPALLKRVYGSYFKTLTEPTPAVDGPIHTTELMGRSSNWKTQQNLVPRSTPHSHFSSTTTALELVPRSTPVWSTRATSRDAIALLSTLTSSATPTTPEQVTLKTVIWPSHTYVIPSLISHSHSIHSTSISSKPSLVPCSAPAAPSSNSSTNTSTSTNRNCTGFIDCFPSPHDSGRGIAVFLATILVGAGLLVAGFVIYFSIQMCCARCRKAKSRKTRTMQKQTQGSKSADVVLAVREERNKESFPKQRDHVKEAEEKIVWEREYRRALGLAFGYPF